MSAKTSHAVHQVQPWLQKLARLGYAAKGVVYILIGALASMPLVGEKGKSTNQAGAIDTIARQPFGTFLLVAIGIGLLGYSVWRIIQAAYNPENKNAIKRIAYVVTAIAYGGLGVMALKAVGGEPASKGGPDQSQIGITARLLEQPFGKYLVYALAAIIVAVALIQLYNGATAKFREILNLQKMSREEEATAIAAGRIGLVARGLVFLMIGWFLAKSAMSHNPQQAKGFAGALNELADAPYGIWVFGATALGLICYGVFMFVLAKYRTMTPVR